jgi:hypothetical protein
MNPIIKKKFLWPLVELILICVCFSFFLVISEFDLHWFGLFPLLTLFLMCSSVYFMLYFQIPIFSNQASATASNLYSESAQSEYQPGMTVLTKGFDFSSSTLQIPSRIIPEIKP